MAAVVSVSACGRVEPNFQDVRHASAPPSQSQEPATSRAPALPPGTVAVTRQQAIVTPVDPMLNPDPRVRRFALEQWTRNPTESLDFVGAAMVDPDESIRERAQQLFDDALAQRR